MPVLTLTRNVGEWIMIDNTRVTVKKVSGGRVELVVLAPRGVLVDRGEIREQIDERRNS